MANQTYYFNRVFSELFDIQVRLMEIEGMQGLDYQNGEPFDIQVRLMELENMRGLDYQNGEAGLDALGYKPKNMEEVLPKPEFEVDLFVFWLLML